MRDTEPIAITEDMMALARQLVKRDALAEQSVEQIAATLEGMPAYLRRQRARYLRRGYWHRRTTAGTLLKQACKFDQQCFDGALALATIEAGQGERAFLRALRCVVLHRRRWIVTCAGTVGCHECPVCDVRW